MLSRALKKWRNADNQPYIHHSFGKLLLASSGLTSGHVRAIDRLAVKNPQVPPKWFPSYFLGWHVIALVHNMGLGMRFYESPSAAL